MCVCGCVKESESEKETGIVELVAVVPQGVGGGNVLESLFLFCFSHS